MATLQNKRIKNTYQSLLKTEDNGNLNSSQKEITDGQGNGSGVYLDTNGNLKANSTIEFGSLKDTGENITITKLVDLADGIENNDNDTTIPTTAAIKSYADSKTAPIDTVNGQTGDVVLDTDDISEGTTNIYYTESRVSANTSVAANTAKTGITTQQASDIETNNAKISFDSISSTKLAGIETGAQVNTVDSVNSQTGAVSLDTDDVSEGTTNLYYTDTRVAANSAVSANTAKTGITTDQSNAIIANTAKNSYPTADATKLAGIESGAEVNPTSTDELSEGSTNLYFTDARVSANSDVTTNTAKVGITTQQAADIQTNNAKVGITTQQAADIVTNNAKVGITTQQASDITTNNAKVGITTDQANAITANTAKNSYPSADASKLAGIEAGAEVNPTSTDGLSEGSTNLYYTEARVSSNTNVAANTLKNSYPTADSTKVGFISVTQAVDLDTMESNIATNNAKNSYPSADATKVGFISVTQAVDLDTIESDVATNNAKVGITTQQASDITTNNAKISFDSTSSTKLAGIEAGAEVNPTASEIKTSYESNANTNAFTDAEQTKLSGIATGAEVNTVDSVNGQTGVVSLSTTNVSEGSNLYYTDARVTANSSVVANTAKISYNATDSTKVGYISITQAVDLDSVENKQNNQYKIIGVAMDYSNRVLSDSGTAEGTQSIMKNIETLILN